MFEYSSILLLLIGLPLIGILVLFFIPDNKPDLQKNIGLCFSLLTFLLSLLLWIKFDMSTPKYQFVEKFFSVP
jgi:NADH-quinone oxidoreductase subunit M